ncbi:MAG: UPF0147 family protein [Candidatus Hodarchaeota archaeon]
MSEDEQAVKHAIFLLNQIVNDTTIPRNIRRAANESVELLETGADSIASRAISVIMTLEDTSQDPNCPSYARTKIFKIQSLLAPLKDEV